MPHTKYTSTALATVTCVYRALPALAVLLLGACATPTENVNSGLWHYRAGLFTQATPRLIQAIPELERLSPSDPRVLSGYLALGRMSAANEHYASATTYFEKALQIARAHHSGNASLSRNALVESGNFLNERKRFLDAIPLLQEAADISERTRSLPRLLYVMDLDNLALAQAGAGNHALSMAKSDAALATLDGLSPSKEVRATRGVVLYNRAYSLAEQGQAAAADAMYKEALSLVSANAPAWRTKVVAVNYAKFLRAQGRNAEALIMERMAE